MSRRALMTLFQLHLSDDGANREDCIIQLFEFEWDEWMWPFIKDCLKDTNLPIAFSAKNKLLNDYKKDFEAWDNVSWKTIEKEIEKYIINIVEKTYIYQ